MQLKTCLVLLLSACGASAAAAAEPSLQTWAGEAPHGVLLLHDYGRTPRDWTSFAEKLASRGMYVVAPDLGTAPEDAAGAGLRWLVDQGVTSVHIVGAAYGANLALTVAASADAVEAVALLSPQANARGLRISSGLAAYGERPLLVVADSEDPLTARTAAYIDAHAEGAHELVDHPGAGGGARMLNTAAGLEARLVGWLQTVTAVTAEASAPEVVVGGPQQLETQGVRLEDRKR